MNNGKINCIEGLRTIGWIGMFLYYFRNAFFPEVTWWSDTTPIGIIYSETTYVRVFFVISGFVLSIKYFQKEAYDTITRDVVKRYFRLMPPVLCTEVVVYILMRWGSFRNVDVANLTGSKEFLGAFNQFTPNLIGCIKEALFSVYLTGSNDYISSLWTMRYEYLGAILVLSAICVFRKNPWRWLFYIVFLIGFSNFYNYFVIGMLIADLYYNYDTVRIIKKYKIIHVGVVVLGWLMVSMTDLNDSDKYSRVIWGIGIILFMLGFLSSKMIEKLFGNRLMRYGGRISYATYIVQWPIIETFSCGVFLALYNKIQNYAILTGIVFVTTFVLLVVVAYILSIYIEPLGLIMAKNNKGESEC